MNRSSKVTLHNLQSPNYSIFLMFFYQCLLTTYVETKLRRFVRIVRNLKVSRVSLTIERINRFSHFVYEVIIHRHEIVQMTTGTRVCVPIKSATLRKKKKKKKIVELSFICIFLPFPLFSAFLLSAFLSSLTFSFYLFRDCWEKLFERTRKSGTKSVSPHRALKARYLVGYLLRWEILNFILILETYVIEIVLLNAHCCEFATLYHQS